MENQNVSNRDCGCSDGCCTPVKKGNLWTKIVFGIIVLAAAAIVTVKLVGNQKAASDDCCETTENPSCC